MTVGVRPDQGEIRLPPENPRTFSEFVVQRDAAVSALKRIDSSLLRPLKAAPFVLVGAILAFATVAGIQGLVSGALPLVAWMGVAVGTVGLGAAALVWRRVRRDWRPARRAIEAWYRAMRTPEVLSLPSGEPNRDDEHAYRVRYSERFDEISARLEGDAYQASRGDGRTTLRIVVYLPLVVLGPALIAGTFTVDHWAAAPLAAALLVITVAACFAMARTIRRSRDASRAWADARDVRTRWDAWRVQAIGAVPVTSSREANRWRILPIVGAVLVILAVPWFAGSPVVAAWATLSVVVPAVVLVARHVVRRFALRKAALGKKDLSGSDPGTVAIRIIEDDTLFPAPVGHPMAIAAATPLVGTLHFSADSIVVRLPTGTTTIARSEVLCIASSAPRPIATTKHWLMLRDGIQLVFECGHPRRLRRAALDGQLSAQESAI